MSFPPSPNDLRKDVAGWMALGINLRLLIGRDIVRPAPADIIQVIKSVEVMNTDSGRDGFQIAFSIGRGGNDPRDFTIFNDMLVKPFTRVIIIVDVGLTRNLLIDGFITNHQFNPSSSPGKSTLTVTGEDYSILMDMHEFPQTHPGQPDYVIANKLIVRYGLAPVVIPPPQMDIPIPTHNDPVQYGTDFNYLLCMARKYNYVFYIEPTDIPMMNKAYWGPSIRAGIPQRALTLNMGALSNVISLKFQDNALRPLMVFGAVQDEMLQNVIVPIIVPFPLPPYLAKYPEHLTNLPHVRNKMYHTKGIHSTLQAYISAHAEVDASKDAIAASGELDTLRYGAILRARRLVSLRGAGLSYDGLYYVKSVATKIENGSCKQGFILAREGTGSIISGVP